MALKMLRENKNKFDLVISDVHMPDMDGFQLLEIVGLEMDLPVIMLSGNGDTKLVMKGITHGACDYLLKPVRIEELKNIWQHVIRRRKFDSRNQNCSDNQDKHHQGGGEVGGMGNPDQNAKLNKRRKDQNEDEDEERDENGHDNEDPSTQKKPRVVWSVELHRKFVAAVNQLGIDKAVPKKILDLMNVEKLTRENVASHLQKYRLYLKRISCVANQQANMVAALGGTNPSFLHPSHLDGLGNFHNLVGQAQFANSAFRSFPSAGMLGRLNTPAGLGMRGLPSTGMIQLGHEQNSNSFAGDQGKFQPPLLSGNNNGSILQGMPTSLEIDQLQLNKRVTRVGELPTAIDNTTLFPVSSGFPDTRKPIGHSNNLLPGVMNNPLTCEGRSREMQDGKVYANQTSVTVASLNSGYSPNLLDHDRYNDNWSSAARPSRIQPNSFPLSNSFKHPKNLRDSGSAMALPIGNDQCHVSSISPAPNRLQDTRPDLQCQEALIGNDAGHVINNSTQQWNHNKNDTSNHANLMCGSMNDSIPFNDARTTMGQSLDPNSSIFHRSMDFNSMAHSNLLDPLPIKHNEIDYSAMETPPNLKDRYFMGQQKLQGSFNSNNVGSLEDLVSAMVKQEHDKGK